MNFNLRTFRLYGDDLWGGLLLSPTLTRTLKHLILLRRSTKRFSARKRFVANKSIVITRRRRLGTTMRFIRTKLGDTIKSNQLPKSERSKSTLLATNRNKVNFFLRKFFPPRFFSSKLVSDKKFASRAKRGTPHYVVDFLKTNPFDKVFVSSKRRTFLSQLAMNFRKFQKFYSSVNRSQFMRLAYLARLQKSNNLHFFINKLERRLDVMLFRTGLSTSLFMAKHFVSYKHISVNDELISMPSFEVALYDRVSVSVLASQVVRNHFLFRFSNFLRLLSIRKTSSYLPVVHFFSSSSYEVDHKSSSSILIAEVFFNSIYYPFKIDAANIELYINRAKKRLV